VILNLVTNHKSGNTELLRERMAALNCDCSDKDFLDDVLVLVAQVYLSSESAWVPERSPNPYTIAWLVYRTTATGLRQALVTTPVAIPVASSRPLAVPLATAFTKPPFF
jgi:hypothetical protein